MADSGFGNPELEALLSGAKSSLTSSQNLADTSGLTAAYAENEKNRQAFEQHKVSQGLINPNSTLGQILGGAKEHSMLSKPGAIFSAIRHPITNIYEPSRDAFIRSVKATNPQTKVQELTRAIPMVGPGIESSAEDLRQGKYAKAGGDVLGEASNFLLGEGIAKGVKAAAPGAISGAGTGLGAVGRAMQATAEKAYSGKISPGMAATMEVLGNHPYAAAATVAAPAILKYGGRATEMAGNALEGLGTRMRNPGTPAEAPVGLQYPESWKPFINRERVSSEVAMEPEGGWGESAPPMTRPTASSGDLSNSPAMQGLKAQTTSMGMRQEAAVPSYDRPSVPYSNEAVEWLQAHTPQQPIQDFQANEVVGRDRSTGLTPDNATDINRRLSLAALARNP